MSTTPGIPLIDAFAVVQSASWSRAVGDAEDRGDVTGNGEDGRDGRAERKPWRHQVIRNEETGLIEYVDSIPL
jgi:hypothetical protein